MPRAEAAVLHLAALEGAATRRVQAGRGAAAPVLDHVVFDTWDYKAEQAPGYYERVFSDLPAGVTHFLIHPCVDGEDIRAIDPENGEKRIGDYAPFKGDGFNALLDRLGVVRINYRLIRDAYRAGTLKPA